MSSSEQPKKPIVRCALQLKSGKIFQPLNTDDAGHPIESRTMSVDPIDSAAVYICYVAEVIAYGSESSLKGAYYEGKIVDAFEQSLASTLGVVVEYPSDNGNVKREVVDLASVTELLDRNYGSGHGTREFGRDEILRAKNLFPDSSPLIMYGHGSPASLTPTGPGFGSGGLGD